MAYSITVLLCWLLLLFLARRHFFQLALLGFPGVVMHECMHLVVGLMFFAKPVSMNLIPRRRGNKWQFGSVSFKGLNLVNAAPVAYAPLLLLGLAWLAFHHWTLIALLAQHYVEWILSAYLVACAIFYCIPSSTDLKAGVWSTLFWLAVGLTTWWLWPRSG